MEQISPSTRRCHQPLFLCPHLLPPPLSPQLDLPRDPRGDARHTPVACRLHLCAVPGMSLLCPTAFPGDSLPPSRTWLMSPLLSSFPVPRAGLQTHPLCPPWRSFALMTTPALLDVSSSVYVANPFTRLSSCVCLDVVTPNLGIQQVLKR